MEPQDATGIVLKWEKVPAALREREPDLPEERWVFAGSCFAYMHSTRFFTAAHCVAGIPPDLLGVLRPDVGGIKPVAAVEPHPSADIACLKLDPEIVVGVEPFWENITADGVGMDFTAFGYPSDTLGSTPSMPTARLFKGHIQRNFDYSGTYSYYAGEMSIPSPAGLSGGPVMRADDPYALIAMAAGNHESELHVESYAGDEHFRAVTRYGVAVLLGPIAPWIDEQLPT